MLPNLKPDALYNLSLCDFCGQKAIGWHWLTPSDGWIIQPHSSMRTRDYNLYRVCPSHGGNPHAPTFAHTPLDVTHKL